MVLSLLIVLVLGILGTPTNGLICWDESATPWTGEKVLDERKNMTLQWRVDGQDLEIAVGIADLTGYVGIGFGEFTSGSMHGADIVTAYIANGQIVVEDRHVNWQAFPTSPYGGVMMYQDKLFYTNPSLYPDLDVTQDWAAVSGSESGGCMRVVLRRKLDTGDTCGDRVITPDQEMRVLYAYGFQDSVTYHSDRRGSTTVVFNSSSDPEEEYTCPTCAKFDVNFSNYAILPQETTYACQSFELPSDKDRHIVAIYPLIDNVAHVHHILVHICSEDSFWSKHLNNPTPCGQSSNSGGGSSPLGSQCRSIVYGWAVGGGPSILPSEAGFKVGPGEIQHITVEIHYDNPAEKSGEFDSTGIRFIYTEDLRQHDAGVLVVGDPITSSDPIPPLTSSVFRTGACTTGCTNDYLQDGPVTVFSSFLHMHSFGKRIWTNHHDSSMNFLGTTNAIDFWNFQTQQTVNINFTLSAGDYLHTHCEYDTSKWRYQVNFGSGSLDEMCMDFLSYYPVRRHPSTNKQFSMCGGLAGVRRVLQSQYGLSNSEINLFMTVYPTFATRMFSTFCVDSRVDDNFESVQNLEGQTFSVPVQTLDVKFKQRPNPFGNGTCDVDRTDPPAPPTGDDDDDDDADNDDGNVRKSTDDRYDLMMNLLDDPAKGFELHWKIVDNTNEGGQTLRRRQLAFDPNCYLSMKLVVPGSKWLGFGFGTSMTNSKVVIGLDSAVNVAYPGNVFQAAIGTRKLESSITNEQVVTESEWSVSGGVTELRVNISDIGSIPVNLPCAGSSSSPVNDLIIALGDSPTFEEHASTQVLKINWVDGVVTEDSTSNLIKLHAILMSVVFAFFLPLTIAFPATHKPQSSAGWFLGHRVVAILTLLMMTGAIVLAFMYVDKVAPESHLTDAHHIIGLFTFIFVFVNPFVALCRPDKNAETRPIWLWLHRSIGLIAVVAGFVNLITGLALISDELFQDFAAYVSIGVGALILIGAYIYRVTQKSTNENDQGEMPTAKVVTTSI